MTERGEMKGWKSLNNLLKEFYGDPCAVLIASPLKPRLIAGHFFFHQIHIK